MNAQRLKSTVANILSDEAQFKIQDLLTALSTAFQTFVGSPQDAGAQAAVSKSLSSLANKLQEMTSRYDSAQRRRLSEIGALKYFSEEMLQPIRASVAQNQMTPAVVHGEVNALIKDRLTYVKSLQQAKQSLDSLGVADEIVSEGNAEVGFLLPNDLFQGELDGLLRELRVIRRILRAFSELVTTSVPPIEVRQISSTDPQFFFGLDPRTIAEIGLVVTWALDRWRQVEEIRKVRSDTRKLKQFDNEEIEEIFGKKIKEFVAQSITQKVNDLFASQPDKAGRKSEQQIDIAWALESIFSRIERGMIVEVRFLPPKPKAEGEPETPESEAFNKLKDVVPQLVFPEPDPNPVLSLPPSEPPSKES